jgi:TonB family protein
MKKTLSLLLSMVIISCLHIQAQNTVEVYYVADEMPEFPGKEEAFKKYIAENVQYPEEARKKNIQGKVFVRFIVNENGLVENAEAVVKVDELLDKEAIRIISNSPAWKPAKIKGKPVKVWYTAPIYFMLENENSSKANSKDSVYYVVDIMPEYPGGELEFKKFIAMNVCYPPEARAKGATGRIYVKFIVDENGKVTNEEILRGADELLNKEALKVISLLPDWTPGKHNGKPVKVWKTMPINFQLQ